MPTALDFGTTYRDDGWGSGLTVLVAMANLLPMLDPADRPLALVHGAGLRHPRHPRPRAWFPMPALGHGVPTRPGRELVPALRRDAVFDAAERSLATLVARRPRRRRSEMMFAAATDHVFIDEGHTLDFTNKAFEAVALVGESYAPVRHLAGAPDRAADRSEESGEWNHPHDLACARRRAEAELPAALARAGGR